MEWFGNKNPQLLKAGGTLYISCQLRVKFRNLMQRTGIEILKNCGEKNWKFFVEKFNFKKKLEKQTGKTYWKNLLE